MAISWDIIKNQLHKKYIVLSTLCLQICQLSRAPALFIAVIKFPFYTMGKYSEPFLYWGNIRSRFLFMLFRKLFFLCPQKLQK